MGRNAKEEMGRLSPEGRKYSKVRVIWRYTVLFLAVSAIIFLPFIREWRTLIWMSDGYHQHIKALIFYSDWLKAGCPADYSLSLGYGGDIISTMQHYCLGEPLAALSYFVPREYMVAFYCALSVFRHYLAGLAFAAMYSYARKGRATEGACAAGAIIYAYCGFAIHFGLQHPMFVTPMIYLPLMVLGVEKYVRDRRPMMFMISVFLTALTDFYFLYILGLAVIAYYFISGIMGVGRTGFGGFIKNGFALLGMGIVGTCMAGVVLAPALYAFFTDPRVDNTETFGWFYSLMELVRIPEAVLTPEYISRGMVLGVGALTVPAGFMMVTGIRKHPRVFVIFLISLAGLAMPAAAYVSNGFSTVNNRWIFIEALILAVMDAVALEELKDSGKVRGLFVFLLSAVYVGGLGYIYHRLGKLSLAGIDRMLLIQAALVIVISLVIMITSFSARGGRRVGREIAAFLGAMAVAASGLWHLADFGGNWASVFVKPEDIKWESGPAAEISALNDESFFRYEYPDEDREDENSSDLFGLSTTGYYYSLSNRYVSDFMTDMAVTDPLDLLNCYHGLDGRVPLLQLAGVKYFVTAYENAPFGFDFLKKTASGLNIYRNTAPVNLVHSYTGVLNEKSYSSLRPQDRQYALLSGALIEDVKGTLGGVLEVVTPRSVSREMKYSTSSAGGKAQVSSSGVKVSEEKASVEIRPSQSTEGEYYLSLTGLKYDSGEYPDPFKDKIAGRIPIRVSFYKSGKIVAENIIQIQTDRTPAGRGQTDYTVSSRWAAKGIDKIVLTFDHPGEYGFDDMKLYLVDRDAAYKAMSGYLAGSTVEADLHDSAMKLVTDRITASGRWTKDSVAVFSVPMSKGWSCTVDGEAKDILTVNGMYIGVEVPAGAHEISLDYQCPMKMTGFIATVAGAALFAMVVIICWSGRRTERKRKGQSGPDGGAGSGTGGKYGEGYDFESVMKPEYLKPEPAPEHVPEPPAYVPPAPEHVPEVPATEAPEAPGPAAKEPAAKEFAVPEWGSSSGSGIELVFGDETVPGVDDGK
ncbi:MAG: YfhO family protein [Eubacterium sp.]|nr:YfhO family protein [Eubacterium sp.]